MIKFNISESSIYKWRYWIGYGLVAIGLIAALIFAGMYLPGGISDQEMQSIVKSNSLNFNSLTASDLTNLPFHLLQHACISIFGVSVLSIKLASIILAFLSAIGIILLLRRWFKPRISILASLIAITTGQFMFIAQDGTPGILYLFWAVWLILLATLITAKIKSKLPIKIAFFILAALSLYTPLSIYTLIVIVLSTILHPHLRYYLKKLPRGKLLIGLIFAFLLTTPLILATIKNPRLGLTLLGIPTKLPDFMANFASLGAQYLGFIKSRGGTLMMPFFELGSMLIILIGIFNTFKTIATAKSHMILIWLLFLIPLIIFNPDFTGIMFLPLVLLLASGLSWILSYWYNLFPRNPYARIGGLIPLTILVVVLVFSGIDRYVSGYRYDPDVVPNFSIDIKLIPKDMNNIVVSDEELPFYNVLAKYNKNISVSTNSTAPTLLVTRKAKRNFAGYKVDRIITASNFKDSDRFYLYKKITD